MCIPCSYGEAVDCCRVQTICTSLERNSTLVHAYCGLHANIYIRTCRMSDMLTP